MSLLGVLSTMVFYAISVSPSLLPRRWWWHGFVSGILMGLGYTLGWLISKGFAWLLPALQVEVSAPPELLWWLQRIIVVLVVLWTLRAVILSFRSSKDAAQLVGMRPVNAPEYLLGFVSSLLVFAFVMQVLVMLLGIYHMVVSLLAVWVYEPIAILIAWTFVVAGTLVVYNKVVFASLLALFARKAEKLNTTSADGFKQPQVSERSGSPDSLAKWPTIGGQGRLFLTHGPNAAEIANVTGGPALEPIRAYAGMKKRNADLEEVAKLAVRELRRAGGFERSVIVVNTATGSGWVDEWLVQPVEYLTRGDCATVSMQYSYLFSAALMLTDMESTGKASVALFEEVKKTVLEIPEEDRPLVFVAGESLGGLGSQAPFPDLEAVNENTAGAIWVGSPYRSHLSRQLTQSRHRGSPEVAPVVDSGRHVRFVNNSHQLDHDLYGRELGPWHFPRTVIAQHASDPVVWYSAHLVLKEPDWLRERAGLDVSPSMRYTPVATYLQVMTDLPIAGTAPAGHGHTYHRELVDIWYRVLGYDMEQLRGNLPEGPWITPEMKEKIAQAIREDAMKNLREPVPET